MPSKGPKITVPIEQKLSVNEKRGNPLGQKYNELYLQQLRGEEHRNFLEGLKNKQNLFHVENSTYEDAKSQLHDQLYGLNLEDYASKIKIKRRLY